MEKQILQLDAVIDKSGETYSSPSKPFKKTQILNHLLLRIHTKLQEFCTFQNYPKSHKKNIWVEPIEKGPWI